MKLLTFLCILCISACSSQIIDMTPEPTKQKFDLSDTEGDGVIQARDECSDSSVGVQVGNNGCGTNTIYTIRHKLEINFDIDSSIVKNEFFGKIEQLSGFMTEFSEVSVSIEGHTSIRGSAEHNNALSKNRAEAIKSILVQRFKIDSDRITTVGYGFEKLLLEGDDEYSHEKNRRIVAELSSEQSFADMKWTIYSVDKDVE